jgi:similar to spore coat protein
MPKQELAPHESIELHEILTFKNVCLTKSVTMSPLVTDMELKSILQQDVERTERHIRELRALLEHAHEDASLDNDRTVLS